MREKWGGIQNSMQTPDIIYIQSVKFPTPISHASTEFLIDLYAKKKLSLEEMASEFKVSRCAVTRELRSRGIEIRNRGENIRRKRGLKYGKKVRTREVVSFKREMEVVEQITDLRAKGFSYHKIADILNSMKIPTKTKKGMWHGKSIKQIIENRGNREVGV